MRIILTNYKKNILYNYPLNFSRHFTLTIVKKNEIHRFESCYLTFVCLANYLEKDLAKARCNIRSSGSRARASSVYLFPIRKSAGGINCLPWHLTTALASPMQYLYSRVELLAGRILYFRKHLRRRRRGANYYRLCIRFVLSYGTMMKNVSWISIFKIRQSITRCSENDLISLSFPF